MRGKVNIYMLILILDRITPAYAGKRMSGIVGLSERSGSPPPMRGKGKLVIICLTLK